MKMTTLKTSQILPFVGISTVTLLTLGAIAPLNTSVNYLLSSYAVELMLVFLLAGLIGFIVRNNTMILTNFVACIVLCSFLKSSHSQAFTYSVPTDDVAIKVAHLVLKDEESIETFGKKIARLDADFLSIQTPIDPTLEKEITKKLSHRLPYWERTICDNDMTMFVFSAYELRNLDTLYNTANNTVSLVGTMFIDSMHQEISFLSTRIPVTDYSHEQAQKQLASLSSYIEKNCQDKPLLTLSGSMLNSWSPEVQAFKSAHRLSDSRMDIGFSQDEHIFYSKDLMCTNFNEIFEGNGVMATYQFKKGDERTAQQFSEAAITPSTTL